MNTATDAPHFPRSSPNVAAGMLALGVHAAFLLLLVVGVSWQTRHPDPVMVDLWSALPEWQTPAAPPSPEPVPQPVPPAPVRGKPAPSPVVRETPPPKAPDIAIEKEKKKADAARLEKLKAMQAAEEAALAEAARAEAEALGKARDRQLAEQKKRDLLRQMEEEDLAQRMMEEEAASETRQMKQAMARAASNRRQAELAKTVGQHRDMIGAKVRGNTRLPDNLKGNPEVRFLVRLLPTGEVIDVVRVQSSGNAAYDDSVERAIRKSSPLPLPEDRDARAAFVPELSFVHRPKE